MTAYHIFVSGRVQGVGFRWFVEMLAQEHGVRGYVKNLPDGRVEVWAQGDEGVLDAFVEQLRNGPRAARVEALEKRAVVPDSTMNGFGVRF